MPIIVNVHVCSVQKRAKSCSCSYWMNPYVTIVSHTNNHKFYIMSKSCLKKHVVHKRNKLLKMWYLCLQTWQKVYQKVRSLINVANMSSDALKRPTWRFFIAKVHERKNSHYCHEKPKNKPIEQNVTCATMNFTKIFWFKKKNNTSEAIKILIWQYIIWYQVQ